MAEEDGDKLRRPRTYGTTARPTNDPEPRIVAIPFRERSRGRALSLLNAAETAALTAIGEPVRFGKGDTIYRGHGAADSVFNLVQGVAKKFQTLGDGTTHVSRFLFPGDLFGLAEQGQYIETAEAIVPCLAYRIPLDAFVRLLESSGALAVRINWRLAHDLREQRHQAHILARNDASGRVAMFLDWLGRAGLMRGPGGSSYLPMSRSDMAGFVGLTIEAVSRAVAQLKQYKILSFDDLHHYHILDLGRFQEVVRGTPVKNLSRRRGGADEKRHIKGG